MWVINQVNSVGLADQRHILNGEVSSLCTQGGKADFGSQWRRDLSQDTGGHRVTQDNKGFDAIGRCNYRRCRLVTEPGLRMTEADKLWLTLTALALP